MAKIDYKWLLECIDSETPGDITVSPGATEATLFFIIDKNDIYKTYKDILGYCKTYDRVFQNNVAVTGLDRQVEMSHPRYPWLYAYSIELNPLSTTGGYLAESFSVPNFLFNPKDPDGVSYKTFPTTAAYQKIRISVKFQTKNYFCLTNEQLDDVILRDNIMGPKEFSYYDRDISRASGIIEKTYYDLYEYLRYTSIEIEPHNEIIVNTTGRGYWKSIPTVPLPPFGEGKVPPNDSVINMTNAGTNFQSITKNKVKITWHKVPKILAFSPQYLVNIGKINFGANFNEEDDPLIYNFPFFNFSPGTLLFTGITTENAGPSFPIEKMSTEKPIDYFFNLVDQQYYNIIFNFVQFVIPTDQIELPKLNNVFNAIGGKMYTNGWNFAPLPSRQFFYMENQRFTDPGNAVPPYWSTAFQRFFLPSVI